MTQCVILFRNPGNGAIGFIGGGGYDGEDIEVFPNLDAAISVALEHPLLKAWPYQIVECDEL